MFQTYPEGEIKALGCVDHAGLRSWHWVELSLQIPCFLVTACMPLKEGAIKRQFIFSQLSDVLDLIATSKGVFSDIEVGLLSPGYVNGTNSYQLGKIKEIWRRRENCCQEFVMFDGSKLQFPPASKQMTEQELELIVCF